MPIFDKSKTKEIQSFLYTSSVHDSRFVNIEYNWGEDTIRIELWNPIFNVKINLTFHNIGIALAIKGNEYGSRETILSLTVEEDFSYLQKYLPNCREGMEDSLYLLFQMFSGEELHIVSKEVSIEVVR